MAGKRRPKKRQTRRQARRNPRGCPQPRTRTPSPSRAAARDKGKQDPAPFPFNMEPGRIIEVGPGGGPDLIRPPRPPGAPDRVINQAIGIVTREERQDRSFPNEPPERLAERLAIYLEALEDGHKQRTALEKAGLKWGAVSRLCTRNPDFKKLYDETAARHLAVIQQRVDDKMINDALDGWEEPQFHQGLPTGATKLRFSETLLLRLAEAVNPRKYSQRLRQEISGPDGKPVAFVDAPIKPSSITEWAAAVQAVEAKRRSDAEKKGAK